MTKLQELNLGSTHITDAGLPHLKGFVKLNLLNLVGTHVSSDSVKALQSALPQVVIKL